MTGQPEAPAPDHTVRTSIAPGRKAELAGVKGEVKKVERPDGPATVLLAQAQHRIQAEGTSD